MSNQIGASDLLFAYVSDVGSIPIARSITHDDSIVLTPLTPLKRPIKPGLLVPSWSQRNKLVPTSEREVGLRWTPVLAIGRISDWPPSLGWYFVHMVLEGSTSPITALERKSSLWRRNNSFSFLQHVGDYAERRRFCPGRFNRAEFPLSRHPL